MALLCAPAIQSWTEVIHETPLDGSFEDEIKPVLSIQNWMSGDFQSLADTWLEGHIGFHNSLVRVINQINYTVFHKPKAEGVIRGKNGQLYEYDYIRAWMGDDFVGEKLLDKKLRQFRYLQDKLMKDHNIDLVLVLEPGKASVYPEDIPDRYHKAKKEFSNYNYVNKRAQELEINLINLNEYFINIKDTVPYPIFPIQGTHWSEFAMWYAADSMLRYIEKKRDISLPEIIVDSIEISQQLRTSDYDIGKSLNLIFELDHGPMPYPSIRYSEDSTFYKPNVLAVADSYYWSIYNALIPKNVFNNEAFWYFYNHVYPEWWIKKVTVDDLNLKQEIEKQDVIFLMITERFLYKFDRGFIDDLFNIYCIRSSADKLTSYKTDIVNLDSWFNKTLLASINDNITLGDMMESQARFLLEKEDPETYYSLYGPVPMIKTIKESPDWYAYAVEKAQKNNISIDEQLYREARYSLNKTYPEALKKYEGVLQIKQNIRSDSTWYAHILNKAQQNFMTVEEALQADAEYVYMKELEGESR
jgi:hypothetical protein